ncbi:MAG: BBP7 family outer membrane beta-barrel protein [Pirellulales bacterium]|nr:BBP7 family outer membrane beta-barrel protein [Pirellulales bacterium]
MLLVLSACGFVSQACKLLAQEVVVGDSGGTATGATMEGAVISDGGWEGGDGGCYGGCDGTSTDCMSCDTCAPACSQRCCSGWFGAEYLYWRLDGNRLPPLITASSANVPLDEAAQLDEPGTQILCGDESVNDGWRSGYRFFGGFWLDCCQTCGIGADYFDIGDDDYNYLSPQDSSIIVGRPFDNTESGGDDAELVSVPDELDGSGHVNSSDSFQGGGVSFNKALWRCCDPCCPGISSGVTLLGGYRYYQYESNLSVTENLTVLENTSTQLVPGTTFYVHDHFRTENEFHGTDIGLQVYKQRCWWWTDGMAKVAMGNQHRSVWVSGTTITSVPDSGTSVEQGGLLTSGATNIGRYDDDDFVVIPEFRVGLGMCVTKCISVRAGYNLIYWGDVARAADHLPPGLQVDPRNLPPVTSGGGNEPAFPGIRSSELVAHGLDASVQFQW